jgi:hypothetical protein
MLTAREWHREQLLEARKKHDLKNRRRRQAGLLPLARCHPLISDSAINAMDLREYCHGHESPAPTPVPAPVDPIPVPAPAARTNAVAHFCLTREEAMSLADNIANALEVRRQDSPEVPPPYPEDRQVAEGLGIRRGRGQRGRPRQPVAVHYAVPPAHPRHANRGAQSSRRPLSPAAQGYENNQGTSYVPFTILDATGRPVPARYIKVHMTDNPYVEARMTMDGPVHRGEIHAAAVHDRVGRTPDIGPDELRLLDRSYQDWIMVDEAIAHVGGQVANGRGNEVARTTEADEGGARVDPASGGPPVCDGGRSTGVPYQVGRGMGGSSDRRGDEAGQASYRAHCVVGRTWAFTLKRG